MTNDSKNEHGFDFYRDAEKYEVQVETPTDAEQSPVEYVQVREEVEPPVVVGNADCAVIISDDFPPANAEIYDMPPLLPPDWADFYRETIKEQEPPPRKSSFWKTAVALLIIFTLGTGTLGLGLGAGWGYFREHIGGESQASANNAPENADFTSVSYVFEHTTNEAVVGTIADMIERIVPSVVSITAHRDGIISQSTSGSGIIFAENAERIFIATNHYVVNGSDRVEVSINGGEPIWAEPAGNNPASNLAVIAIEKTLLVDAGIDTVVMATFGDSDSMRVGDTVLVIGNAMGYGISTTRGGISAPKMDVHLPGRVNPLVVLRTDAAINYGNSGGPLINTRGEIIGINIIQDALFPARPAHVEGMGYSIASNIAAPILRDLATRFHRPALGISGRDLFEHEADARGIPHLGVLIDTVVEGEAAYQAGIRRGDIITGFNGLPVFNFDALLAAMMASQIGDTVEVNILRNANTALTVQVELREMIHQF